jgi:beta-lactamase class D
MTKNKTYYILDLYEQGRSMTGFLITKWEAIQWFIGFLRNPEYKMITFTKPKENTNDDTGTERTID